MKKLFLATLNDFMVVTSVVTATIISGKNILLGILSFIIVYILLDAHTYFSKKLNFYNNFFIKN